MGDRRRCLPRWWWCCCCWALQVAVTQKLHVLLTDLQRDSH